MRMENGLTFKKRIMKKLLLLALVGMSFMSCEKEPIKVMNHYRVEILVNQPNSPKDYNYIIMDNGLTLKGGASEDTLIKHEWAREGEKSLYVSYSGSKNIGAKITIFKNGGQVATTGELDSSGELFLDVTY